jgi:hypothetical protein
VLLQLATHLQHLGDTLRQEGKEGVLSAYEESETLITEVIHTYPNHEGARFILDLVRHGRLLLFDKGLLPRDRANRVAAVDAEIDGQFDKDSVDLNSACRLRRLTPCSLNRSGT